MASILVISSEVACGGVGGTLARFVLMRLGHEAWVLPTVHLSNHPGHSHWAGARSDPAMLSAMLDALEANGWLGEVEALLTGYLPGEGHVAFALDAAERLARHRADVLHLADPTLGDDPKGVYIDPAAARAIRERLVPRADIAMPNRFELAWLTGESVRDAGEAERAARALGPRTVIATSVPAGETHLANLLVSGNAAVKADVRRRPDPPHGTGDMMAALFLGHLLNGAGERQAFARAVAGVDAALAASRAGPHLALAASQETWAKAAPWPLMPG